ncbi:MAG: 16S rRNA (cytidine(1402)-2'-O)-methyltransferase [Gammaproteobacteria bacterium]
MLLEPASKNPVTATLYVVATPIGNLADISERARQILDAVDFIAAEDTRHSARLLHALDISTPLLALHEHNEAAKAPALIERLLHGESAALISDAGTPLISDPGYRLVRAAQDAGIAVRTIPGASAPLAALSIAGLATDRFAFEGFLPPRKAARQARLKALAGEPRTLIFFEAPHRLAAMLADCATSFGAEREATLARELTKLHESCQRAPLGELARRVAEGEEPARGECVVLIAGAPTAPDDASPVESDPLLAALIAEGVSPKTATAVARRLLPNFKRRDLYQRAVELASHGTE